MWFQTETLFVFLAIVALIAVVFFLIRVLSNVWLQQAEAIQGFDPGDLGSEPSSDRYPLSERLINLYDAIVFGIPLFYGKKTVAFSLLLIFSVVMFIVSLYVLMNGGEVNAGFALTAFIFSIMTFLGGIIYHKMTWCEKCESWSAEMHTKKSFDEMKIMIDKPGPINPWTCVRHCFICGDSHIVR